MRTPYSIPIRIAVGLSQMMQGVASFNYHDRAGEIAYAAFGGHILGVCIFLWGAIPAWRILSGGRS